jgi:hypothetical protein
MVVDYPSLSSVNFAVPDFKNRGRGTLRITKSPGHPSHTPLALLKVDLILPQFHTPIFNPAQQAVCAKSTPGKEASVRLSVVMRTASGSDRNRKALRIGRSARRFLDSSGRCIGAPNTKNWYVRGDTDAQGAWRDRERIASTIHLQHRARRAKIRLSKLRDAEKHDVQAYNAVSITSLNQDE